MARNHATFAAVALGLMGICASASAQSQSCTEHTDCASGNLCVFDGGGATDPREPTAGDAPCASDDPSCGDVAPPAPEPEPSTGTCQPLPKGLCVDQSDCSVGLTCEIGTIGTDCAEPTPATDGGSAPTPTPKQADCVPSEEPAPYGYCTLPVTVCTTDAQCLTGLKCVEAQSSGGSAGEAPVCDPSGECSDAFPEEPLPEEPAPAESTCQVSFDSCTANTDCDAGYECVEAGTTCTSGGSTGSDGSGTGTGTVEPAQPKQQEPECQSESYCFPKFTPCTTDAQCQANWVCFSFDGETLSAPDWWEQDGPVQGCLPKGLALAAEAGIGSDSSGNDEGTKGAAVPGSGDGNSCSVGFGPRAEGAALVLMALGMLVRRRRARA